MIHCDPPAKRTIEQTRVLAEPFDPVWAKSVSWFAAHNVTIEKIEKPSGLITAKYQLAVKDDVLDAGRIWTTGLIYSGPVVDKFAFINVFVRSLGERQTEVTVNVFGSFEATAWWGWLQANLPPIMLCGKCVSTGVLEESFFAFMKGE
jgi:hypothetical protein